MFAVGEQTVDEAAVLFVCIEEGNLQKVQLLKGYHKIRTNSIYLFHSVADVRSNHKMSTLMEGFYNINP